ncbi:TPA: hypothetical protein N3A08_004571, partial [Salmonella enterica subsp. salamae serovar 9,46:z4,z24:z39:z42]|nr:hypothetical protein [Salmonella enterica subsp. salamae serovar 9,46:z4,z24:z39:z42]
QGGVSELTNLTLNASGSSDRAVSSLDKSVIRSSSDLTTIISRDLGSTTAVDASSLNLTFGSSGWDNTNGSAGDSEGTGEGTSGDLSVLSGMNTAHDWVLSNTTVQSAGNVTLKGVSFSNSTLNITGVLALSSDKWLTLSGDTLNVTQGVTLNGTQGVALDNPVLQGNTTLKGNGGDIWLRYNGNDNLSLSGMNLTATGNITADISSKKNLTLADISITGADGNISLGAGSKLTLNGGTNLTAGDIALSSNGVLLNGTGEGVVVNATTGNLTLNSSGSGNLDNGGGNITLQAAQNVSLAVNSSYTGTVMKLSGLNISAGNDLSLNATSTAGAGGAYNVIILSGGNLSATAGNLSIRATGKRSNTSVAVINLSSNASLTAGQNITLNGSNGWAGVGVKLANVTLNAAALNLTGAAQGGTGFSLANTTWQGGLAGVNNITLSSAGSSANSTNIINTGVLTTEAQIDTVVSRGIENLTTIKTQGMTLGGSGDDWTNTASTDDSGKGGGWVLDGVNVSKSGNISLKNVGFSNSTLTAGNISLSSADNSALSFSNVTLNASSGQVNVTSGGDLTLSKGAVKAEQDIDLSANGNMTLGGSSAVSLTSTSGNITLQGGKAAGTGNMTLNNVTLNASAGSVNLTAQTGSGVGINLTKSNVTAADFLLDNGAGVKSVDSSNRAVVLRSNTSVNVTGNATFNVTGSGNYAMATGGATVAAKDIVINSTGAQLSLQGDTLLNASGNITLNGCVSKNNQNAVETTGSNITLQAGQNIGINGISSYTGSGANGVVLSNLTLNAATVNITGVTQGKAGSNGFNLNNITLAGDVASNISNLTLNSAGSAAGVYNIIGSGIIRTQEDFTNITARKLGSVTQVDATYWSGNNQTYAEGLNLSAAEDTDGWIYSGANVTVSGGATVLDNVMFTAPQTLNISGDSLTINIAAPVSLTGDNTQVNVTKDINITATGAVNIGSALTAGNNITVNTSQGDVSVTTNLSAGDNITLNTAQGQVVLKGNNSLTAGDDISLAGNNVKLTNTTLNASQGDITISGMNGGLDHAGVALGGNVSLLASQGNITIDGKSSSHGYYSPNADLTRVYAKVGDSGGVNFDKGNITFTAKNTEINALGVYGGNIGTNLAAGIVFNISSNVTFNGNATINASAPNAFGVWYYSSSLYDTNYNLNVNDGNVDFNINGGKAGIGFDSQFLALNALYKVTYNVGSNASLHINASSTYGNAIESGSYLTNFPDPANGGSGGMVFTGAGDVTFSGSSQSGNGVDIRYLDSTGLTGKMTVEGTSVSGNGVYVDRNTTYKLKNATITGSSQSGSGILLSGTTVRKVDLNGNTLCGTTVSGAAGVSIAGNNTTITNGTITGIATGGSGSGVKLTGGSNYTVSGATVTGQSVNGPGVAVSGNLDVENGASITGCASGSGVGFDIQGNLTNTDGKTVTLKGTATSGTGLKVTGNTQLSNASLSGTSVSGSGLNITKNLVVSGESDISGTSQSGTGVNVQQSLVINPATVTAEDGTTTTYVAPVTGKSVDGAGVSVGADLTGGKVTGTSENGAGVQLADGATVTQAQVSGSSTGGDGVAVTGHITLDNTTAQQLEAKSVSGAGLSLQDNADVNVVTTVEQPQKDASGNPVTDADGNPVMETVTVPVSEPVTLSGTSESGAGVATSGDVTIKGVTLSGTSTSATGTGVSLSGSLTIGDTLSGVTASATDGTALSLNDATVSAPEYTTAGKDFVLAATTSGDGAAVKADGSNSLSGVILSGTTTGNGSAVEVSGTLATDSAVQATVSGADSQGSALVLDGGTLQGTQDDTPVTVTAKTEGTGTAVQVAQDKDSTLNNVVLDATATDGTALQVSGTLNTQGADISSTATGSGTALNVDGGTVHSQGDSTLKAEAENGRAAVIKDGGLTGDTAGALTVTATTASGQPALSISGDSTVTNSLVSGTNTGDGNAVVISGTLTGNGKDSAFVTGSATAGRGAVVTDGSALTSVTVTGGATTGTGLDVAGDATLTGATASGTSVQGTGTTVSGHLVSDSASSVTGTSSQGDGLALHDGTLTGGRVAGHSESGSGVVTTGSSRIDGAVVSATSAQGTGLDIQGELQKTPGTTLDSSSVRGLDNVVNMTTDGMDADAAAVQVRRLQSATAAVSATGALPPQAGYVAGGVVPVPQRDYRDAAQPVNLSVCTGDMAGGCRTLQMDAKKPQSAGSNRRDDDIQP